MPSVCHVGAVNVHFRPTADTKPNRHCYMPNRALWFIACVFENVSDAGGNFVFLLKTKLSAEIVINIVNYTDTDHSHNYSVNLVSVARLNCFKCFFARFFLPSISCSIQQQYAWI